MGVNCKYCVLFARDGPTLELGVFVNRPLNDFKKLSDHFHGKKFHKTALEAAEAFTVVVNDPGLAIDHRLEFRKKQACC